MRSWIRRAWQNPAVFTATAALACGLGALAIVHDLDGRGVPTDGVERLGLALVVAALVAHLAARRAERTAHDLDASRKQVDWLDATYARYFSPQVARLISERGHAALATGRRDVSVLFGDLSGFTRYSERHSAEMVVATLAAYLDELARVALLHDGTIDKYMGDEIMVVWNAPMDQADHARRALHCARDMQIVVDLLNAERERRGQAQLALTVGLNSGEAVVGHFGGERRVQYTVIGDVVNVAKRLQGLAQPGQVVAAEATFQAAGEYLAYVEEHQVRGREQAVRVGRIGAHTQELPSAGSLTNLDRRGSRRRGGAVAG